MPGFYRNRNTILNTTIKDGIIVSGIGISKFK